MQELGKLLLVAGIALAVIGALLLAGSRLGLGHLPGDFAYRKDNVRIYFPLATSVLLSLVLTLLFWLFRRH